MLVIFDILLVLALLYLLQYALYRRLWGKGLTISLRFSAPEATEGQGLSLEEEITNAKLLPLPVVSAKFSVSRSLVFRQQSAKVTDLHYQEDLFSVGPYQRITRRLPFVCSKRGLYRINSIDLSATDLLQGQHLVQNYACGEELLVLPRRFSMEDTNSLFQQLYGEITVRRFTNPDPFAFRGIREYSGREPLSAVNWRASARMGALMVNQYDATASQEVLLLLNLSPYRAFSRQEVLEEGIRVAASAAEYFTSLGATVGLYTNGLDAQTRLPVRVEAGGGPGHGHAILRALARLDLSGDAAPFDLGALPALATGRAVLLVSSYEGDDLRGIYAALHAEALAAAWVLPHAPGERPEVPPGLGITTREVSAGVQTAEPDARAAG